MKNYIWEEVPPVRFTKSGVNEFVTLKIVNVQKKTQHSRVYTAWNMVGKWTPQVEKKKAVMGLEMHDVTWPGGALFPPKGKPEKRYFRIVTLKEKPYRLTQKPKNVVFMNGNDSTLANNTVARCCAGLCIDLLRILSERMRFDYTLYEVPDQTWGLPDERTGEWNGLIRQIMDGQADMILTSLKITPKRNEHIAFSVPFLETGIAIVVSIRKGAISPTAFLDCTCSLYIVFFFTPFLWFSEPYDYPSWCLILVFSVHATGASIFIYEWLSPRGLDRGRTAMRDGHRFSLFRSLWLIWAMLFGASVSTDTPRGVSSRFLANIWALFALVFLASYTANLAAFMITKDVHFQLSGIKDIKLTNPYTVKPPFRFGTIPNGSTEENIRENHPRMYEYMKQFPQRDVDTAIQALKDRRIEAFIYDATPLEYRAGNVPDCDLKTVGDVYAATGYGIGLPLDSDLKEEINSIILDLQESGEMERLRKFWLAGACHRKRKRGQSSHTIGILNFTSAFILLACGMVIGVALLFGRSCLKKMDKGNCCSLISLSMGRSLTFEQSVIEAIGQHKRNKCKDPLCETQLWKVKHELDLALIRIDKLKGQLEKHVEIKSNGVPRFSQTNDDVFESQTNSEENLIDKKFNDSSNESTLTSVNRRSIRRSPSYTNAVTLDEDRLKHLQKVRFHEGKYYVEVNTDTHSAEVSSL
ncbi:hypothetical protein KUTeg_002951 [Tegillarca granosa]|uniref:Uncharacterized protein n=1 Tax=Tegillarca granosa TaxID=220873 RepID=A0ABQ9FNN7_TEGGR|nr:hypothetical protein KUTeg_002951 [Tegillarca granosa]